MGNQTQSSLEMLKALLPLGSKPRELESKKAFANLFTPHLNSTKPSLLEKPKPNSIQPKRSLVKSYLCSPFYKYQITHLGDEISNSHSHCIRHLSGFASSQADGS